MLQEVVYGEYNEMSGKEESQKYYCFLCLNEMSHTSNNMHKCIRCGFTFREKEMFV